MSSSVLIVGAITMRLLGFFVMALAAVVLMWPTIRGSLPMLPIFPVDRALATIGLFAAGIGLLFVASRAE